MSTHSIKIAALFVWIGFVCAISFMEAWLKFTAPGVSLTDALSIGQVVFNTLNKVELILASVIFGSILRDGPRLPQEGFFGIALTGLLVQTIFILPALSQRIDIYLQGAIPKPSSLHMIYVTLEAIKVTALFIYGFKQLNHYESNIINTR